MDHIAYSLHYMSMLNILHSSHVPECNAHVSKHFDGYYVLQLMTEGCIDLSYGARRSRLEGCWFFPSYPGPYTTFHCAPGYASWHHRHIAFTGPRAQHWIAAGLFSDTPQQGDPIRHAAMFDEILSVTAQPDPFSLQLGANLLERLLLDLVGQRKADSQQDAWLARVLTRLDDATGRPIDYPALARMQGMSVTTLRRRFQNSTGISIHNYLIESKIARAKESLQHPDRPIKHIAEQLGYRDVYFFSRQFKQRVGLSPAAFRRSL